MKTVNLFFIAAFLFATTLIMSFVGHQTHQSTYKEVKIGNQVWMAENLNVDRFRNGDLIPEMKSNEEWETALESKQPAWCFYDNDPAKGKKYGKLYNFYAMQDPRGLAPEGWHIPSQSEWITLVKYLGDSSGYKMKSTSDWAKKGNGTNESGFSGLPGGFRNWDGGFWYLGKSGYWWRYPSSNFDYYMHLHYQLGFIQFDGGLKAVSVRCIRD